MMMPQPMMWPQQIMPQTMPQMMQQPFHQQVQQQQQQQQQPFQQQMLQQPQQQLQPPQPDNEPEASSSESEELGDCGAAQYQKNDEASITRSAKMIGKLPKIRVLQLVEAAYRAFDSTLTASITIESALRLIFLFSRVRPNTPCVHLRVKTYKKMMDKFSQANKRLKSRMDMGMLFDSLLDDVGMLNESLIAQKAAEANFEQVWLDDCLKKKAEGWTWVAASAANVDVELYRKWPRA
jgi:hypothetical protein